MPALVALAHPDRPQLVTVEEAMRALCLSRPTLYRLIAEKRIRTVLIGRARRVPTTEIDRIANRAAPVVLTTRGAA
ncbi:MAG: helix-turn-helix domain-containing protein [Alphaproteobacteria bacterium]|nr:helix-turn-helix domain-containing protein [Alphaproteobacteria bacterium]